MAHARWKLGPVLGVVAHYVPVSYVLRMNRPIIPAALPEEHTPASPPQPYSPAWLNALNDTQRQSPEIREFSRSLHDSGGEHVTWLVWHYQEKTLWTPPMALWQQGSVFFLDCGRGPFAVTAGHVYEQFLKDCQTRRIGGTQVANIGFDLADRLIAWGKNLGLDIATFRITPAEIAATGKKIVRGVDGPWPPPPQEGEVVYFGGFPGGERDRIAAEEFTFGLHSALVPITSFTEYQLCCQFDRRYWTDIRGLGLPPVGYELGGISGGPMLQPVFNDGVWNWQLVGVISEAVTAQDFERITAVRAHFILPDGLLAR